MTLKTSIEHSLLLLAPSIFKTCSKLLVQSLANDIQYNVLPGGGREAQGALRGSELLLVGNLLLRSGFLWHPLAALTGPAE